MTIMTTEEIFELGIKQVLELPEDVAGRHNQVKKMLAEDPRESVGKFCCYSRQVDTLHLAPFEVPPCWAGDEDKGPGGRLRRRMMRKGISPWHPDPQAALGIGSWR
jgi:hypothetical protein